MHISRRGFLRAGTLAGLGLLPGSLISSARAARPLVSHSALDAMDWTATGNNSRKRLSHDPETGAQTFYLELPENWVGGGVAHYHTCSEEVYVLDGDVTLNGRDYLVQGSYLYRPSGIVHGHYEASRGGCRLIIKTDSLLDFNYIEQPESPEEYVHTPSDDGRQHIVHLETPQVDWVMTGEGQTRHDTKVLSLDRKSGASTRLIRFPAGWRGRLDLDSAYTWEWFVIGGEARLDDATRFSTDSYSIRPAGSEQHAFVSARTETRLLLWRD